jgi:nitrite reductase (NADH) small subunit/3-phenylpropionate/trans-cinnamate dioxygenase ferredoxin subunit
MPEFETVAKVGEIPIGKGAAFEVNGRVIAVFNDEGTYRAMDDMCPHMGASLSTGFLESSEVTCPWHAWRFDTRTGAWCDNPTLKVDTFEVKVDGDEIQVRVFSEDTSVDSADVAATRKQDTSSKDACSKDTCSSDDVPKPREGTGE